MGQRVIADNWSLQAVHELFVDGLDETDNPGIGPLTDPEAPPAPIPEAVISFEALFDLLTDVVLRDQILVDDQHHQAWFGDRGPLAELAKRSIVRPHGFLSHPERVAAPRTEFVRRLVLNPLMAREQAENEAGWRDQGATPHRFTSQLVWGGAGMLARAWVNEAPYTPHPLRRRLFERAGIVVPGPPAPAAGQLQVAVEKHREALYRGTVGHHDLYGMQVILPALPALILREAQSLPDMFTVASQMREELAELRVWLSQFQEALTAGEFKAIDTERKRLRTLSKQVERALGQKGPEGTSLNIGWSWLKLSLKLDPQAWISKFSKVQTQINRLTFAPSGRKELGKLLGFFGQERSPVGLRTIEHFARPGV